MLLLNKKISCPSCTSHNLRPMWYGMGAEGGCVIGKNSPRLKCIPCNHGFMSMSEIVELFNELSIDYEIDEEFLMNELLLNQAEETSEYVKMLAIRYIRSKKNLAHLRLVLDGSLQSTITKQIETIMA